jgi:NAD+--asparagine ADP-ribosyltransferase
MDIISAQTFFVKQLIPFFKEWGFEYIDVYSQFRKTDKMGFKNVILSISQYETEIWIEVTFGIRKDEVERITQPFLSNLSDFQNQTTTISVSLGKLNQNPYFRYKAENEEDLEVCAEQLIDFMTEEGMTFLEEKNSLQELDLMFNKVPKHPILYVYNQHHRFFKGIVLAKITNNPKYEELSEIYFRSLIVQKANETIQSNFKRLVAFLVHYSIN